MLTVSIEKDENNISKGFGFVSMEKHEDAQKAVQGLNGSKINGLWNILFELL